MKPISGNIFTNATEDTFIIQVNYPYDIPQILVFVIFVGVMIAPLFLFEVVHPVFTILWPVIIVCIVSVFFITTYNRKRVYTIDFKNEVIFYVDCYSRYKSRHHILVDRLSLFRLSFHVENHVYDDHACYYLTAIHAQKNLEVPVLRIYDIKIFLQFVRNFNEAFPGKRILEYYEKL